MNLKSQYNQLSALAAKADDYTKKTKDMSDAMQQVYDNFPHIYRLKTASWMQLQLKNLPIQILQSLQSAHRCH